jgi:hypothetical protein
MSDVGASPPENPATPQQPGPPGQPEVELILTRIFEHVPHPRYEHHQLVGPSTTADAAQQVHGTGFWGRLNSALGLKITVIVGTMWAAYIFALVALLSLPQAITSHNLVIIVAWISSNFLQLVLLPIIIVGQNIQAAASDKRANDTYKDAEAIMHECLQLQVHLQAQDKLLLETVAHVQRLANALPGTPTAA